jgi:hypothetical protein
VLGDGMVGGGKFSLLVESVGGEAVGVFVECNFGFFFLCFFVCSIFLVSHLLLLTIGYQGLETIIEGHYREKTLEGCTLFIVALIFALTDFIRFSISAKSSRHLIFN